MAAAAANLNAREAIESKEEATIQTFLPFPDFAESARCLDRSRLGKQRVEAMQILRTNLGHSDGWASHPAVLMWRGHDQALASYGYVIAEEWRARGYTDSALPFFVDFLANCPDWSDSLAPPWLGDPRFHASHRAALLHKDPVWYGRFGWTETPALDYFWPTKEPA